MKLLKLADRTISILGLLLFGALTGYSLFFTVYFSTQYEEIPYEKGDLVFAVLAVCGLGLFCMYRISCWILKEPWRGPALEAGEELASADGGRLQERRIRVLLGVVLVYTLCFCVLWVIGAGCIPVGDQASVCLAAEGFRTGDFSMLTQDSYEKYLFIHPHQLGLTALIELIFAIFGNGNFKAFEFLNCLGAVVCVYAGYRITRLLTEDKRAWVYAILLSACCFPLFFYVTFVYGEIPALTYSLLAVWFFLEYQKGRRPWQLVLCCIACSLACLVRNNSMILLIAFVCILVVNGIGKRQWRYLGTAALLIVSLVVSRWGLKSFYEGRSGVKLNDGAPMILYVAMGMQKGEGAPGWSNGYILHAYWGTSEFDGELASAMAVNDIRASLSGFRSDPVYAAEFYREKFTSQWNDPTYECFAMTHINGWARCGVVNSMYVGKLHALMTWFMNQYQSLIFMGVFLWLIFHFWKKKELEQYVLLITIFGGCLFHMLWEAKGRYILPYFVMMLPMAAVGLAQMSVRLRSFWMGWMRKKA